jgi:glycosyltransferase involved in cell wall biosynthesis
MPHTATTRSNLRTRLQRMNAQVRQPQSLSRDIALAYISLSVDGWHDTKMGRHALMAALARERTVVFARGMRSLSSAIDGAKSALRSGQRGMRRIAPNLFAYYPPPYLCTSSRFNLYNTLCHQHFARSLTGSRWRDRRHALAVVIWHPSLVSCIDYLDPDILCYFKYDNYAGYDGVTADMQRRLARKESKLLTMCDLAFTSHPALLPSHPDKAVFIGNGVDFCRFQPPPDELPRDLARLKTSMTSGSPLAGYVGRITSKLDFSFLKQVIQRCTHAQFVFIGPVEPLPEDDRRNLDSLRQLPNCHFLSARSYESLPAYMYGLDICLLPYKGSDYGHMAGVYPLKMHEYLACGKLTLATPFNAYIAKEFQKLLFISHTAQRWARAIQRYPRGESARRIQARIARAAQNNWDTKAAYMESLILERLAQKRR